MARKIKFEFKKQIIEDCSFVIPDRYAPIGRVAVCGQAKVIKANDKITKTKVVIKKVFIGLKRSPEECARRSKHAFRELILVGMFDHENIIKLLSAYTPNQSLGKFTHLYLVMPCTKTTLKDRLEKKLPDTKITYLIYKLVVGLTYLHSIGIVHEDLKPDNIGIDAVGEPIIFDFGSSRLANHASVTGGVFTIAYMAPEIFLNVNFENQETKHDMFSLGCIWVEMINGKQLFGTNSRYVGEDHILNIFKMLDPVDDEFINRLDVRWHEKIRDIQLTPKATLIPTENFCETVREDTNYIEDVRETIMMTLKINPEQRWSADQLLAKFEQRNWNNNDKIENKLKGSEHFIDACREAKENKKLWKKILFDTIKQYEKENDIFGRLPAEASQDLPTSSKRSTDNTSQNNPKTTGEHPNFPLHVACLNNDIDELQRLLVKMYPDQKNNNNSTALHVACEFGYFELIRLLVNKKANVNALDNEGRSPLHFAVQRDFFNCVELLLNNGAIVDSFNKDGWTALHIVSCCGYLGLIRCLLKYGADPNVTTRNSRKLTPLHLATQHGNSMCVDLLLDSGAEVDAVDSEAWTSLYYAVRNNHLDCIRLLLENNANVNASNKEGWTPLHTTSEFGYLECSTLLLDTGADVNATNLFRSTPLHIAVSNNKANCVQLFLERGANTEMKNHCEKTPLDIAKQLGAEHLVNIFKKFQNSPVPLPRGIKPKLVEIGKNSTFIDDEYSDEPSEFVEEECLSEPLTFIGDPPGRQEDIVLDEEKVETPDKEEDAECIEEKVETPDKEEDIVFDEDFIKEQTAIFESLKQEQTPIDNSTKQEEIPIAKDRSTKQEQTPVAKDRSTKQEETPIDSSTKQEQTPVAKDSSNNKDDTKPRALPRRVKTNDEKFHSIRNKHLKEMEQESISPNEESAVDQSPTNTTNTSNMEIKEESVPQHQCSKNITESKDRHNSF